MVQGFGSTTIMASLASDPKVTHRNVVIPSELSGFLVVGSMKNGPITKENIEGLYGEAVRALHCPFSSCLYCYMML